MSTLSVDTIQGKTTAGTVAMPAGHVVQTFTTNRTDTFTVSGVANTEMFSILITPKFASSKILITCNINGSSAQNDSLSVGQRYGYAQLYRDSTHLTTNTHTSGNRFNVWFSLQDAGDGANHGYGMANSSGMYLDSPNSTSQIDYSIKVGQSHLTNSLLTINRSSVNDDQTYTHYGISSMTVQEIAQ
jgi:hypothetical protein